MSAKRWSWTRLRQATRASSDAVKSLLLQWFCVAGGFDRAIQRHWAEADEDLPHQVDDRDARARAPCALQLLAHFRSSHRIFVDVLVHDGDPELLEVLRRVVAGLAPRCAVDRGRDPAHERLLRRIGRIGLSTGGYRLRRSRYCAGREGFEARLALACTELVPSCTRHRFY